MKSEKINFDNLTAEQVGKLFPIRIVPYNPDWKILFEMSAYSDKLNSMHGNVSKISDAINNTYLKINGEKRGTLSYSHMVNLLVGYYVNEMQNE